MVRLGLGILVGTLVASAATAQTSLPAAPVGTRVAPADQQRLNDLLSLVEGQNTPQARRTGARELLRHDWPEVPARLSAILTGGNRPAKVAVALAFTDLPTSPHPVYVNGLLAMLSDSEAEVRDAASVALAAYRNGDVIPRLRTLMLDPSEPMPARLAAIDTLGHMTQRDAVKALIDALGEASPLSGAALAALERATAKNFNGDIAAARSWWDETGSAELSVWQELQIERLVSQSTDAGRRLRELETRLAAALREGYTRTAETDRAALLLNYLNDPCDTVRLVGLELVQSQLTEGKQLAKETLARLRELLSAAEPGVRAAAVRTVASLRDASDASRFLQLMSSEPQSEVRLALTYGLGYVGGPEVVPALLALVGRDDRAAADEAITALGRLAERGVLDAAGRASAAAALLDRTKNYATSPATTRERLMRTMGRIADPRFGPTLVEGLNSAESPAVRTAAIRGIAALLERRLSDNAQPQSQPATNGDADAILGPAALIEPLLPLVGDADAGVRRTAIEALSGPPANDDQLQALWSRLSPTQESEEAIRTAAWRGALRILGGRPPADILSWVERLPDSGPVRRDRSIELLQLAEKSLAAEASQRGELGRVRARIAAGRAAQGQNDEALSAYLMALDDLIAAQSADASRVVLELMNFALASKRFDSQVSAAVSQPEAALDVAALWDGLQGELESRLHEESAGQAVEMIGALRANPPTWLPSGAAGVLDDLLARARKLQADAQTRQATQAIAALRTNPVDAGARQVLAAQGVRAAPALREALRNLVSNGEENAAAERALHDLLQTILPDWSGFAPDASRDDKLKALDSASV